MIGSMDRDPRWSDDLDGDDEPPAWEPEALELPIDAPFGPRPQPAADEPGLPGAIVIELA
jgi:hypothetical protein